MDTKLLKKGHEHMQKDKELQMLQNTNDSDANIPKNKEDANSYDWGKHPNSLKALLSCYGLPSNVLTSKELKKLGDELVDNYCGDTLDGHFEKHKRKDLVLRRIWNDAIEGDMKKIELLAYLGCFND